ncbi:MAG: HigA family addiction module antitoxin [Terriglobales bacterium]
MPRKKVFAIHPGEILREEFMKPMGLSSYRLAKELRLAIPRINEIVREERSVTADTALRLARYFGTSAQVWMNLQTEYDLRQAQKKATDVVKIKPRKRAEAA